MDRPETATVHVPALWTPSVSGSSGIPLPCLSLSNFVSASAAAATPHSLASTSDLSSCFQPLHSTSSLGEWESQRASRASAQQAQNWPIPRLQEKGDHCSAISFRLLSQLNFRTCRCMQMTIEIYCTVCTAVHMYDLTVAGHETNTAKQVVIYQGVISQLRKGEITTSEERGLLS